MGQFVDGEAAIADEDDPAAWQPASQLQCALPGPVSQQLVTTAALTVGSLRRGEQGQDRQSLDQAGPWHRGEHHEAQPAQPAGHRDLLLSRAAIRLLDDGARVYRLDDPPDGLHALLAGEVRLVSYPLAGMEMVGKIIQPGQWFGELSVIDGKGRPHDAIVIGPSRVLTIGMAAIAHATAAAPGL